MNRKNFKTLFWGHTSWSKRHAALLGIFLACIGTQAWSHLPAPRSLAELDVPGFKWDLPQTMQLSEVPMHVKHFSSGLAVVPAAQALALHSGLFERALTLDGKVVLSGMQSGWHWLAEISTFKSGSQGYVSALQVGTAGTLGSSHDDTKPFIWLPPQARLQLDHHSIVHGRRVVQQIYSVALPTQTLTSYVRKQLRAEGWMPEPELAGIGAATAWGRSGSRLMLLAQQGVTGTSLYVHYAK